MVGHAAAAVGVLHCDSLEAVPLLAHRQVAGLGPPPASCIRAGARARAGRPAPRGLLARAQLLLEREASRYGTRPSWATQSSSTLRRLPCARWTQASASGRPASAGGCGARGCGRPSSCSRCSTGWCSICCRRSGPGSTPCPAILIAVFGNLVPVGALAPWLARRIWARRPAAAPGAPPMAQVEVLTDRVGTGLLVASLVGVLAAGLAARPLVVAETDAREHAANAILAVVLAHSGNEELTRNVETAQTARLRTATSAPASRATTGAASGAGSSTRTSARRGCATRARAQPAGGLGHVSGTADAPAASSVRAHLEQLDAVAARPQRVLGHEHREALLRLAAQAEAAPGGTDAAVHRHRHVAQLAGGPPRSCRSSASAGPRHPGSRRRAGRRWRPSPRSRRAAQPEAGQAPAEQLGMRPDPVERRPRRPEQDGALGAGAHERARGAARSQRAGARARPCRSGSRG